METAGGGGEITECHLAAGGATVDLNRRKRLLKQGFKIFIASLGTWIMGTMFVWPSVLAQDLSSQSNTTIYGTLLQYSSTQMDMAGSLVSLGSLPGAWISAPLVLRLGRRISMIIAGIIALIGWLGVALLPTFTGILVFRFVCGLAVGSLTISVNAYGVEMADLDVRGAMIMIVNIGVNCGQVVTALVGYDARYYIVAFVDMLVPLLFILGLTSLPESPSLLLLKGREEEARAVLVNLRGQHANIDAELQSYREMNTTGSTWRGLLHPDIIKSILVTSVLFILMYFTGYMVINANASRIFADSGSTIDEKLCTIIILLVQVCGGASSFFLLDRIGRKKTLIISFCIMCISLTTLAIYEGVIQDSAGDVTDAVTYATGGYLEEGGLEEGNTSRPYGWIPLVCLMVSQAGVAMGVNPIPYILSNEYFPTWIRAQAASVPFSVATLASFASLQLYTPMRNGLTQPGLYGFYAAVCALGVPFTVFFVRETMGEKVG
nr:facilitated trehalose transporter Tret1-like isoform X1 [Cherax quadricarinatus]XP_053644765.1 facilitated trehalose transporter Tret1-like isoform X1 [Cherax quadricarinatus]XP_053644766.1 facilitated trehalose transporter Tret1-like isoform X1 [Cherax quadricarinatus]XP_053644767.1 facilitated trehalose transporter Tret1-like isoform X1 [Cherax quadricarinatus]XP_053644768.1 facilitated trehalose transporter Tret1-like isoform X1 [Cherax quadricarinatus]XP_053644769.1 facilitated trehalos